MLKVSQNDLSFLAPFSASDTYSSKVEEFLKSKGYVIPEFSNQEKSTIKDNAIFYWKENKHENLTQAAWLYAYCAALKIELDLTFKR